MTLKDPLVIAIIRGLYTAVGMAALTGLTAFATTNDTRGALITGALAFLGALGFRGGVEGAIDQGKGPRQEESPAVVFDAGFQAGLREGAGPPRLVPNAPNFIPPVDFDQPYHRDPRDGTPHPGNSPTQCQWCLAVKPVTP